MAKSKTTIHGLIPGEGLGLDEGEVHRTMTGSKLTPPPFDTRTLWSTGLVNSVLQHHLSHTSASPTNFKTTQTREIPRR